ncbi:MAG: MFS transporter [Bryobacteraceae bacterium]
MSESTVTARRSAAVKFIVCLGIVSLFADMTYEGAHSVIGPYLKDLGASASQVGVIAGLGEMFAASLRLFSGRFADRTRAYWTITISGYLVNVLVVPALAFAGSWQAAALLIIAERTSKAIRGPARDVLLSEATKEIGHGWGFGLHAAFDQTGAVLGPLMMFFAVAETNRFGPAFLPLAVPAVLAVVALLAARAFYPARAADPAPVREIAIPKVFWAYVTAAGLLAFGCVDFPLLAFHFQNRGLLQPATIPLVYSGAMAVNGITALLFGRLFDRYGVRVLVFGILVSLCSLPLGFLGGSTGILLGVACWGAGRGAQDACLRPGIAQVVSMNKRGSAFGSFNAVYGVAWFAGSALMGFLYDVSVLALVTFGVVAQLVAAAMFLQLRKPLLEAAEVNR